MEPQKINYMRKLHLLLGLLLILSTARGSTHGTSTVEIRDGLIFMHNNHIERAMVTNDGFYTRSFVSKAAGKEYSSAESQEFSIDIDGKTLCGRSFDYKTASVEPFAEGQKLTVKLQGRDAYQKIGVTLFYWIYDSSATVRKQLLITNKSDKEVVLSNLDVESLRLVPADIYMTNVYANYGTNITRTPYIGDYYDPAILLYNEIHREGILLGNEAPGILKRTDCYSKDMHIGIGMKRLTEDYPFKKYLHPGETFTSPRSFVLFTKRDTWQECFEADLGDFVREHLGVKLFERERYPLFYYCTWIPFKTEINEKLVRELADNLKDTGVEVLLIDDGWQDNWGDYNSHPERFPNGIEKTCEYIRSKGMKPGMWFSIASINRDSKIYMEHPEWAVQAEDGSPGNVYCLDNFRVTMSMSSPWFDHIHQKLRHYIRTCGLGYVKLDFAVATSAYITDKKISGDYSAKGGAEGYRDQASSYWSLYNASTRLFDLLKTEFPELIVDCTFEVWGKYHIIDYALIQHADVDWLTNYEFDAPQGPISIRQIAAERSKVIPVQTMMIGNQLIDSPMHEFTYLSLASSVQLMCGDPRNLTPKQKSWYKNWSDWFRTMDKKYAYTRYHRLGDTFEKAAASNWDGCYRFNPERQGGVLFFYRNNSLNEQMTFKTDMLQLDEQARYHLYEPCGGKDWGIFSGKQLLRDGITIRLPERHRPQILGIEIVQ